MKQFIQRLLVAVCLTASFAPLNSSIAKTLFANPNGSMLSSITSHAWQGLCAPFNTFWGIQGPSSRGLGLTAISIGTVAALIQARSYCNGQSYSQEFQKKHANTAYFFDKVAVPLIDASFVVAGTISIAQILKTTGLIKGTMRLTDQLLISLSAGLLRLYFDHISLSNTLSCKPEISATKFADLVGFERVPRIDPNNPTFTYPKDVRTFSPIEQRACLLLNDIINGNNWVPFYQKLLICGPAGTGKTAFAKALSGSAGIPILTVPINDIKKGEYGRSEENITFAFQRAEELALKNQFGRAILLLDEFEMFGEKRDLTANHKADAKLSGQLLWLLADEQILFKHVIVVACTNHPELIDPALISRFTGKIERIELPAENMRQNFIDKLLQENHFMESASSSSNTRPAEPTSLAFARMTEKRDFRFIQNIITDAAYRARCEGISLNKELLYSVYNHQCKALTPSMLTLLPLEIPASTVSSSSTSSISLAAPAM